jgi:hypothetical protein
LQFVPTLRSNPSACFAVFEDLLVNIQHVQMSRNALNTIGLVNLTVNHLEMLVEKLSACVVVLVGLTFEPADILFPME